MNWNLHSLLNPSIRWLSAHFFLVIATAKCYASNHRIRVFVMPSKNLAQLEEVPLREIWNSEADFSHWLTEDENLKLLSEEIGLELEWEHKEAPVGPYRADITCKDAESGQLVVIENQIEETDHPHLGKILTYAAGLDASIIIWIAQEFTEEHRAALDWLNERTKGGAGFFGVEIKVKKIGDSPPAAVFDVVSKPNDFSNQLKQSVGEGISDETKQLRLKYWTALVASIKSTNSKLRCRSVRASRQLRIESTITSYRAAFEMSVRDGWIGVYVLSSSPKEKELFRRLKPQKKADIERELGTAVDWRLDEGSKYSWIAPWTKADVSKESDWPRQHAWLKTALEKLLAIMENYLAEAR